MRKSIHVTYHKNDKMWNVCNGLKGSCEGKYSTQKEAIQAGKKVAMETSAEFVIHGKDGKIRQSTSYGNDPVTHSRKTSTQKRR